MAFEHPLATLQPQEISRSSEIIRRAYPRNDVVFRIIAIKESIRSDVTQYLEAQHLHCPISCPPRQTYASYRFKGEAETFEDVIDLTTGR